MKPKSKNPKSNRISVCFSEQDRIRINRASKIDGSSVGQFIRRAALLMVQEFETTLELNRVKLPIPEPEPEPEAQGTRDEDEVTRIVLG